jgi:ParB family transcriptional regulator, chromosome partitioning protein
LNKRKDALREMLAPIAAPTEHEVVRVPVKSGSLKAMGLTLQSLTQEVDQAKELREQLSNGERIIEIDPQLIDASFVRDRLDETDAAEFEAFQVSLAEQGQQVPVLVRPSPRGEGRFQLAYGHRRVEALRRLRKPVKAIVRELSDEELVVAQGKENLERRDLSFIERALFAARLEEHGLPRSALQAALTVHKGNLSTMITVARSVPEELIVAIGPAPKIGRPRWEQLAQLLKTRGDRWRAIATADGFSALGSDMRFERVLRDLSPRPTRRAEVIQDAEGLPLAQVERGKDVLRLTIKEQVTPEFGGYLLEHLPEIYAAFRRRADV